MLTSDILRQTAIYAAGVGLGASKAKDISKLANDYSGYVSLAKDAVRITSLPILCNPYSSSILGSGAIWHLGMDPFIVVPRSILPPAIVVFFYALLTCVPLLYAISTPHVFVLHTEWLGL